MIVTGPIYDRVTGHITKVPAYVTRTGCVEMSAVHRSWWNQPRHMTGNHNATVICRATKSAQDWPAWNEQDVRSSIDMEKAVTKNNRASNAFGSKPGSFGRTSNRFGHMARSSGSASTVNVTPPKTPASTTGTKEINIDQGLPQRWVTGGDPGVHTVKVVRSAQGDHFLVRRGGAPPDGWQARIDPGTLMPYLIPPTNGPKEKKNMETHSEPSKCNTDPNKNRFDQERYVTRAILRDLKRIPRFVIDTPGFQFDSHADNPGWMLSCKQRHYRGSPGKLRISLIHTDPTVRTTVTIRPSNHNLFAVVASEDDFVKVFQNDFTVETNLIARQVHRPLVAYSDDELLAELRQRVDARLAGWKPRVREIDRSNVIDLDQLRQEQTALDESRLSRILAA